jgi:hypothetical protein
VNNAVARTAGLATVAVIPVLAGLSSARGVDATTVAFGRAMVITAVLPLSSAAVVAFSFRPVRSIRSPTGVDEG